jgi:hypothetical protein
VDLITKVSKKRNRSREGPIDTMRFGDPVKLFPTRGVDQSRVEFSTKQYLLRVMVNESIQPPVVVTAYRTSKISKYWAQYDARLRIDNRVRLSRGP